MSRFISILLSIGLWLALVACQSSTSIPTLENAGIVVTDVWTRSAPASAPTAAFYMIIENNGPADRLLRLDSQRCDAVELHQTTIAENGIARMEEVAGGVIDMPAHSTVRLEVGNTHAMCLGKEGALEVGEEIPVRLVFEHAGHVLATATVR